MQTITKYSKSIISKALIFILMLVSHNIFSQDGWITDKKTGCQYYTQSNVSKRYISWSGECVNGFINGQGILELYEDSKLVYTATGIVINGKFNGQATFIWVNGNKYSGNWKDGKKNGIGTLTLASGDKYSGEFKDDNLNGQGTYIWASGEKHSGGWKDGKKEGKGIMTSSDGTVFPEHIYRDGLLIEAADERDKQIRLKEQKQRMEEEARLAEIKRQEDARLAEIKRQEDEKKEAVKQVQIKKNENKALWKLGNKLCATFTDGSVTVASLNAWNEDKSMMQIKIITSSARTLEGQSLTKGNIIWVDTKYWHLCLDEEVQYSLNNDNSSPQPTVIREKAPAFVVGQRVIAKGKSKSFLGEYKCQVLGVVVAVSSDKVLVEVQNMDNYVNDMSDCQCGDKIWGYNIGKKEWYSHSTWSGY